MPDTSPPQSGAATPPTPTLRLSLRPVVVPLLVPLPIIAVVLMMVAQVGDVSIAPWVLGAVLTVPAGVLVIVLLTTTRARTEVRPEGVGNRRLFRTTLTVGGHRGGVRRDAAADRVPVRTDPAQGRAVRDAGGHAGRAAGTGPRLR